MRPTASIKLGFQAHYPQLETKLAVRGADEADLERKLAPIEAEVRRRLGNFIVAEDDDTLEGVVLEALRERGGIAGDGRDLHRRPASPPGWRRWPAPSALFRRGMVARDPGELGAAAAWRPRCRRDRRPCRLRAESGASHALAVLIELDDGADRPDFGATICIGIADRGRTVSRQRPPGRRPRLGARSAPPSWGSTACAATCSACRSTNGSTSSGAESLPRRGGEALRRCRVQT